MKKTMNSNPPKPNTMKLMLMAVWLRGAAIDRRVTQYLDRLFSRCRKPKT